MNEAETRAELIDPALAAAGWGVVEGSAIKREVQITQGRLEGYGKRGKAEIADYVLIHRNTKLAVIEAKKRAAPLTEGKGDLVAFANALTGDKRDQSNRKAQHGSDLHRGLQPKRRDEPPVRDHHTDDAGTELPRLQPVLCPRA